MNWSPSRAASLHADDDRLLADIEMAEAADQAHAIHLPGLLLEAADQQHGAIDRNGVALADKGGQAGIAASGDAMEAAAMDPPAPGFATRRAFCGNRGRVLARRLARRRTKKRDGGLQCWLLAWPGCAYSVLRQDHDEVVLVDAVEQVARLLVEQITIDHRTAQQIDPLAANPPFRRG